MDDEEAPDGYGVWKAVCGHCGAQEVTVAPIGVEWPVECAKCGVWAVQPITKWQAFPVTN